MRQAALNLRASYPQLTARLLDQAIWEYQRTVAGPIPPGRGAGGSDDGMQDRVSRDFVATRAHSQSEVTRVPSQQPPANLANWPAIERHVDEVGRRLQAQRGQAALRKEDIDREIARVTGLKPGTMAFPLPSDRCYNWVNAGPTSFMYRVFLRKGRGEFTHVGPDYPYTGPVLWEPRGRPLHVGDCHAGQPHLDFDPRAHSEAERAQFLSNVERFGLSTALQKWKST